MKVTAENISTIGNGTTLFIAQGFTMPMTVRFFDTEGSYFLASEGRGKSFQIYKGNPNHDHNLKAGNIFTDYEEMCVRMREQCLDSIDHFNKHQLKNNPIVIRS